MSEIIKLGSNISQSGIDSHNRSSGDRGLVSEELLRPTATIRRLHDVLIKHATHCDVPSQRRLADETDDRDILWLVTSGHASLYRSGDDLKVGMGKGPLIVGLQRIFTPYNRHYVRVSRDAEVAYLSAKLAHQVIDEMQLWNDVAEVLAYFLRLMTYRDEHLVSRTSYTTIRTKLLEYMASREVHIQNRTGIVAYIQTTTLLSKSLIYNTLNELCKGGYIQMSKAKLDKINYLPERF